MPELSETLWGSAPGATLLLAVMVVFSLIALYISPPLLERNLFRPHWLLPRRQYSTVVTSTFIHADWVHLLFNAFTFWSFGFSLERAIGTGSFLALYALGIAVSSMGTYFKHRADPSYQCLGASGAVMAVLFASILYFPTSSLYILPIPVPIPAPLFALGYLAYSYYAARQNRGRINHDAHLTGALAGIAYVTLTDPATLAQAVRSFTG